MAISNHRKKIILFASIAFVVLVGFSMFAPVVLADTPPAQPTQQSNTGSGILEGVKEGIAFPVMIVAVGILTIVQSVLFRLLAFSTGFLQQALGWNFLNPANMPLVVTGWGISRDIANSLFILIILWIAFTIIFNIERLGGKALLVRVITVALLVNFSLAMVTVVFALSNEIANVFAKNFPQDDKGNYDIGAFILNKTKVTTLLKIPSQSELATAAEAENSKTKTSQSPQNPEKQPGQVNYWRSTLLSSLGIKQAEAQTPGATTAVCTLALAAGLTATYATLGAFAFVFPLLGYACFGSATLTYAPAILSYVTGYDLNSAFGSAVILSLSSMFLFLLVSAIFYATIALLIRYAMMIFLPMLAPLALLAHIIPARQISTYWDQWLEALFRWAFFAPAFYFLFYMSLLMISNIDALLPASGAPPVLIASLDTQRVLALVFAIIIIGASVRLAKKMGGATADTILRWGKAALGTVLSIATRKVGGRIGRDLRGATAPAAGKITTGEGRVARTLRAVPGVQRGAARYAASEREAAAAAEKQYQRYTADELGHMLPGEFRPTHRAAIMKQLESKKGLDKISDAQAESEIKRLKNLGEDVKPFLKQKPGIALRNPDLVLNPAEISAATAAGVSPRQMALKKITDTMNPDELAKLDKSTYGDPDAIRAIWQSVDTDDLGKIGIKNKDLSQKMKDFVESMGGPDLKTFKASLTPTQLDKFNKYFDGSFATGTGMGWKPKNWIPTVDKKKLANGSVGIFYAESIDILDGTYPYSVEYLNIPAWLTAVDNTATGGRTISLSGTPPARGRYDFSFEVTDATGGKTQKSYRINVG